MLEQELVDQRVEADRLKTVLKGLEEKYVELEESFQNEEGGSTLVLRDRKRRITEPEAENAGLSGRVELLEQDLARRLTRNQKAEHRVGQLSERLSERDSTIDTLKTDRHQ